MAHIRTPKYPILRLHSQSYSLMSKADSHEYDNNVLTIRYYYKTMTNRAWSSHYYYEDSIQSDFDHVINRVHSINLSIQKTDSIMAKYAETI